MPCALQSSMVCPAAGIHLGQENALQHQLSGSLPSPLLCHQAQSEATWEFIKPGCTLETSLRPHWLPCGSTAGTPLQYRDPLCGTEHPRAHWGPHRAPCVCTWWQQSRGCTALLVPSAPSPPLQPPQSGDIDLCPSWGRAQGILAQLCASSWGSVTHTWGTISRSDIPHPQQTSLRENPREIHDLPWDMQGTMCFPPFLLGSLGRSQALWWCGFPFPGAVHVLREERAAFQGWGDGYAVASMDLEQPRASMGVTDL